MNMSGLVNFSWMSQPSAWIGLVTLVALEIVLGIDNIVFLTILSDKLPKEDQPRGQKLGMTLAVIPRLILLLAIPLVLAMKDPLFTIPFIADPGHGGHGKGLGLSLQDLVVLVGGIFLFLGLGRLDARLAGRSRRQLRAGNECRTYRPIADSRSRSESDALPPAAGDEIDEPLRGYEGGKDILPELVEVADGA
jgi:predicted tellurium resistance membrane protein TerC